MRSFAATCGTFAMLMGVMCAPTRCAADDVVTFAYHSFDATTASIYGVRYYGHWLRYNPDVSAQATAEARNFLAAQLGR